MAPEESKKPAERLQVIKDDEYLGEFESDLVMRQREF
jgi:hypothetical protein